VHVYLYSLIAGRRENLSHAIAIFRRMDMRQSGTVKFFNQSKGFGFITPDEGGKDVFVHISAVERSGVPMLDGGMRVSFETEADPRGKGPKAMNLQMSD